VTGQPYGQLPDATLSGYEFEGWWTDPRNGEAVSAGTVVSAETNHTLYAHWWDGNPFHDESLPTDDEVGQATEDAEGEEYEPGDEPEGDDPSSWPQPPADYIFNLSADEYDEDLEPADGSIDEGGEFPATDQQLSDFIAAMNGEGPEITSEQEQEENAVQAARQLDPDDECEDEPEQQTSGYAEPEWNPDFMFGVGGDQPETFQREYETYAVTGDSEPHSSEDTDSFVRMLSGGVVITSGED
jgi:uncharacterized repeat protein (TIGR02543 family)